MKTRKRITLACLALLFAVATLGGAWDTVSAAKLASKKTKTVSISAGKPVDAWLGKAGVYFTSSAYSGKLILTRPAVGTLRTQDSQLNKQDLKAHKRYLDIRVQDLAGKQVSLLRGLNYVYFNLNASERALWTKGDLGIYFFDTAQGKWVECLANHLVSKGKHGRLACLATHTGMYALAELVD
jgi:hypothetical protein